MYSFQAETVVAAVATASVVAITVCSPVQLEAWALARASEILTDSTAAECPLQRRTGTTVSRCASVPAVRQPEVSIVPPKLQLLKLTRRYDIC